VTREGGDFLRFVVNADPFCGEIPFVNNLWLTLGKAPHQGLSDKTQGGRGRQRATRRNVAWKVEVLSSQHDDRSGTVSDLLILKRNKRNKIRQDSRREWKKESDTKERGLAG